MDEISEELKEKWYQLSDQFIYQGAKSLVQFYAGNDPRLGRFDLIGSGFCISYSNRLYLVTATHVLKNLSEYDEIRFVDFIFDRVMLVNLMFTIDEDNDMGFLRIDSLNEFHNVINHKAFYCIELNRVPEKLLGWCIQIGFPSSKNKQQLKFKEMKRSFYGISEQKLHLEKPPKTSAKNPIFFNFNPREMNYSNLTKPANIPDLNGMSGGPIFELYWDQKKLISVALIGVVVEQNKSEKLLIGSPICFLRNLIDKNDLHPVLLDEYLIR